MLAGPEGAALSLSQPGCDKPQCRFHLCKPTKFPSPSTPQLLSATSANLFILFLFFSLSLCLWAATSSAIYPQQHSRWSSECCCWVWWLICYLGILGSLLFSHVTEKNHTEPKQKRGNGGVQMGGDGAEIQELLWKNSAEVLLSKPGLREQGHSKSNNRKETVLWLKLHWESWTHTPELSHREAACSGIQKNRHCSLGIFTNNHTQAFGQSKVEGCSYGSAKYRLQNTMQIICPKLPQ